MKTTWCLGTGWMVCLVLSMLVMGCSHGGVGAVSSGASEVRVKCDAVKNQAAIPVMIDATNMDSVDKTLPETHLVEVCKGKHSLVWFAEDGEDLLVSVLETKGGNQSNGKLAERMRCGNVVADDGTKLGSLCLVKGGTNDEKGSVFYQVRVKTGNGKNKLVDPQVIIKE